MSVANEEDAEPAADDAVDGSAATVNDDAAGGDAMLQDDLDETFAIEDAAAADGATVVVSKWQEYAFDPADVAAATTLIDTAAAADPSIAEHRIYGAIGQLAKADPSLGDTLVREVGCVFLYRLHIERGVDQPTPGAWLEPKDAESRTASYLRPISEVTDDMASLWEALAGTVTHPRPLARLHDLLFTARRGNVGEHGRCAITHYLATALQATDHDRVELLLRTWTIARATRRDADEATARAEMWTLAHAHAGQPNGGAPGIALPLLAALAVAPRDPALTTSEPELDAVLDDLSGKYRSDHLIDTVAGLQRKRAAGDKAMLDAIDRRRIQARFDRAADAPAGQVRMHFLQAAAALARDLGVEDMADRAVVEMQNIKPEELEWVHFTASSAVPTQIYEAYLREFDSNPDWRVGLATWLTTSPPSGDYAGNIRAARDRAKISVLRHLFGSMRFGTHGLPQQSSGTDAALDHDVRQGEAALSRGNGNLLAMALDRIRKLGPDVTDQDVAEWLVTTYGSDPSLASRFARSLVLFWEGRRDEAAHTVAPLVEAGARSLLRELDEPLYRVEKGKTIGQFPGLGAMLPKLHSRGLDKNWQRYLETVLLPDGFNLRNVVAHGLIAQLGRLDAVLMLRAAGLLVVIAPPDGSRRDIQEVQSALRNAPPPARRSLRRRIEAAVRAAAWELRRPH